ncbi:Isc10 [Kluyveromyces lactis]|nr:Isc10 [Kluyveromyces lactis]
MSVALNENAGPYSAAATQFEKVIKVLKPPSLKEQAVNSRSVKSKLDRETQELIDYIRTPEPAFVREGHTSKVLVKPHDLSPLDESSASAREIVSSFIPPAENIANESRLIRVDVPARFSDVPPLLPDDAPLDLRCLGGRPAPGFDIGPLKVDYCENGLYENETIRMEWKMQQILSCEFDDRKQFPTFAKEMELREKISQSKWYHYPLYYALGIDSTGLFQLKDEFDWYQKHPWSAFDQIGSDFLDLELEENDTSNTSNSGFTTDDGDLTLPISETSERSLDRYLP